MDLKNHLTYRDKNFTELFDFNPTIEIGNELKILIDERMKKFVIAGDNYDYKEKNSDLIPLSSVTSCRHRIVESKEEIFFRDSLGRTGRFTPRAFSYAYDFVINIETNLPFMRRMEFKINEYMIGKDNPTLIQVSEEKFTNKIKDFSRWKECIRGKSITPKMLKILLNTKHMNTMQKKCVRQFCKVKKMQITVIMTNLNILFVNGVVQR